MKMTGYIGALFTLTMLLALGRAKCSNLNCENLDAATCKQRFGDQLDQQIMDLQIESIQEALRISRDFYTDVLQDLLENDQMTKPIRKHLSIINAALPKISKDTKGEAVVAILKEIEFNFDPIINIDNKSKEKYDDLLFRHDVEKYRTAIRCSTSQRFDKMIKTWKKLFFQLRPVDLAAYSEYEKFYTELKETQFQNFYEIWHNIGIFFDAPFLKLMYSLG